MPTIYLVDLENVVPKSLPKLGNEDIIFVFIGAKQLKLNTKMVMELQPYGKQVQYIEIARSGKNSADFHIAFYLGKLFAKRRKYEFVIISKDKGYDPLVDYINKTKLCCNRINEFTTKSSRNRDMSSKTKTILLNNELSDSKTDEYFEQLKILLSRNNNRPKGLKSLNSYATNILNISSNYVNVLIDKLVEEKIISVEKTKILYLNEK